MNLMQHEVMISDIFNYRNATALKLVDPATRGRARAIGLGKSCNQATPARAQTM